MDLIPEVDDEFIRDKVSQKLYRPLVNLSNKVWIYWTQTKTKTSPFQMGDSLRYTNEGHNETVDLVGIKTNDNESTK